MKKILLSGFVIATFIGYALQQRYGDTSSVVVTPNVQTTPSAGFSNVQNPTPTTAQGPTPPPTNSTGNNPTATPTPHQLGAYRDGSYTGPVTDAFYGNVQVQAVVSGGKLTDVKFLQYPNDRSTSRMINSQAMPLLTQEAIQAQNANVNGVSGASATSGAFVQSLQSALAQAK